jgi:hypothetical protein
MSAGTPAVVDLNSKDSKDSSKDSKDPKQDLSAEQVAEFVKLVNKWLNPYGMQCAAFKASWYNHFIKDKRYLLNVEENTLCLVTISGPAMLDVLKAAYASDPAKYRTDPVNTFCDEKVREIGQLRVGAAAEFISVWDKWKDGLWFPMSVAGHAAGLAYYFQSNVDLKKIPWTADRMSCAIHPIFGGWFGFRGALVYHGVTCSDAKWEYKAPIQPANLQSEPGIFTLLHLVSLWQSPPLVRNMWRDLSNPSERYNQASIEYFTADNADERNRIISTWPVAKPK